MGHDVAQPEREAVEKRRLIPPIQFPQQVGHGERLFKRVPCRSAPVSMMFDPPDHLRIERLGRGDVCALPAQPVRQLLGKGGFSRSRTAGDEVYLSFICVHVRRLEATTYGHSWR